MRKGVAFLIGIVLALALVWRAEQIVQSAASYPTAVKSFTTRLAGQTINAAHMNDVQDEIAAIEGGLLNGLAHDLKFIDATHDIGKSGATRPRDFFLSRNAVVGGTLGVTGIPTFTAQAVFNGGATFAGNLIATDATHDIGASGATRFRDFFLSRNAVIGGTLGVTGVATLTAQAVFTGGYQTGAVNNYINDTTNANMTTGLTINQGGADNQILALKSSDVTTVLTTGTVVPTPDVETDDFLVIAKRAAATGGVGLAALGASTLADVFYLHSYGGAPDTTDVTGSNAAMNFFVAQHDGANGLADMAANSNGFAWGEITAAGVHTVRMLLKADDGELHLGNTTLVALDSENDIQAVRSLQRARTEDRGIALTPYDPDSGRPAHSYDHLRSLGIVGPKDVRGDFLIRVQPYLNLHDGAIWQLHVNHMRLQDTVTALEQENRALMVRLNALERSGTQLARNR